MIPIVHIHGILNCESLLFVLNTNANDIQRFKSHLIFFTYVIHQLIKIMELKYITLLAHLYRKYCLDNWTTLVYYSNV